LVTVISTVFQTNTQSKQQALQPQIQALQKKYPNSQTDPQERRAMALEQSKLMKSAGVHPFLPFLFLIIQFPLFICIWSALQGSAALASGSFFGLYLVTPVSQCFTAYKTTPGAYIGIIIFVVMTLANILSSASSLWFNNWRTKKFGNPMAAQQSANGTDPSKMGKYMTYGMMIFVVIMGWSLPAGMGIYWFISAVISIVQTVMMEAIQAHHRHQLSASTGDGSTLAAMRRSRHHQYDSSKKMKRQEKKSGSDKPLWR
jgi:YidC/Oxa1 family membrane protein insertase